MSFAAAYVPNFLAQAALRNDPGPREEPSVVVDGKPPQVRVVALNSAAREMGLWVGMTRADAEVQSRVQIRERSARLESLVHLALQDCLARFSPWCEDVAVDLFVLDISGLSALMGTPAEIAGGMRDQARNLALYIKVGVAGSIDSAIHAARIAKDILILPDGREAGHLKDAPLDILDPSPEILATLHRWAYVVSANLRRCRIWL